jgi:hypothetical protein
MSVTSARSRAGDQAANPADSAAILRAGYATVAAMTVLALVRGALGAIWFTETLWKLPWKNYGCPADFTLARSGLAIVVTRWDWLPRWICDASKPERRKPALDFSSLNTLSWSGGRRRGPSRN